MPFSSATNAQLVRCRRPAMGCLFEAWLAGEDEEHLMAVGEAALDEIARIERSLSFFDPASEVSRINREAADRPVRVDMELWAILSDCIGRWHETGGYFDITVPPVAGSARPQEGAVPNPSGSPAGVMHIELDDAPRTVHFTAANAQINLGGYGKGYALDAAGHILREHSVDMAVLHGGTSSVLSVGGEPGGAAWKIGLRDPFARAGTDVEELQAATVGDVELADAGLSTSAVFGAGGAHSDIIDPQERHALREHAACTVIAPSALDAEVWSTALLAMGEARARDLLQQRRRQEAASLHVAWLSQVDGDTRVTWLNEDLVK